MIRAPLGVLHLPQVALDPRPNASSIVTDYPWAKRASLGAAEALKARPPQANPVAMPPRINIPPVTRILLITLGLQSILSAAIRYKQWSANSDIVIPYLNLIPQLSLIYPWTFLTTTLVESNVFTLAIAAVTLYHGGRYLERAWSSKEFAKFLLITALIPNTLCFGVMVTLFTITRNESWTYVTHEAFALGLPPFPIRCL